MTGKGEISMYTHEKISTFRERFLTLMEESGKTSIELSKELKVSNQTISAWKTGARSPKDLTVIAISEYFNVSVPWLMGFDEPKKRPSLDDPLKFMNQKLSKKDEAILDRLLDLLVDLAATDRRKAKNILLGLMEGAGDNI